MNMDTNDLTSQVQTHGLTSIYYDVHDDMDVDTFILPSIKIKNLHDWDEALNGNAGSWTNSDDTFEGLMIPQCIKNDCIGDHYHRKTGSKGKSGAARRIAEKIPMCKPVSIQDLVKCLEVTCENPVHFHLTKSQKKLRLINARIEESINDEMPLPKTNDELVKLRDLVIEYDDIVNDEISYAPVNTEKTIDPVVSSLDDEVLVFHATYDEFEKEETSNTPAEAEDLLDFVDSDGLSSVKVDNYDDNTIGNNNGYTLFTQDDGTSNRSPTEYTKISSITNSLIIPGVVPPVDNMRTVYFELGERIDTESVSVFRRIMILVGSLFMDKLKILPEFENQEFKRVLKVERTLRFVPGTIVNVGLLIANPYKFFTDSSYGSYEIKKEVDWDLFGSNYSHSAELPVHIEIVDVLLREFGTMNLATWGSKQMDFYGWIVAKLKVYIYTFDDTYFGIAKCYGYTKFEVTAFTVVYTMNLLVKMYNVTGCGTPARLSHIQLPSYNQDRTRKSSVQGAGF